MTEYTITVRTIFVGHPDSTDEDFGRHIDAVMIEFETIADYDMTIGATLTERTADFSAIVPADAKDEAKLRFLADLRCALHAAGTGTPGWPEGSTPEPQFEVSEQHVSELQPA